MKKTLTIIVIAITTLIMALSLSSCKKDSLKDDLFALSASIIWEYGRDVLATESYQSQKAFMQHGEVSTYEHEIYTAFYAVKRALEKGYQDIDWRSLIRGTLLHDYVLYDWHEKGDGSHRLHGLRHAFRAMRTANRDFNLNPKEKNIIASHMFPLNLYWPSSKEAWFVTNADTYTTLRETFAIIEKDVRRALEPLFSFDGKNGDAVESALLVRERV